MALDTFSIFYYGLTIDNTNNLLNFLEPGEANTELTAEIETGTYNYADLMTAIKNAMDLVGDLDYTLTNDRDTRKITFTSTDTFELLIDTGTQSGLSPWTLLGFTGSSDLTGASTYTGDSASGSAYENQFVLQDYTPSSNFKQRIDSSVNESASGDVEVINFGLVGFFEMAFDFITDLPQEGMIIKNNSSGVSDANDFFESITARGVFEFMPDIDDRGTFFSVIIDRIAGDSKATGYRLREKVAQNLPGYYEVRGVRLRVIE